MKFLMFITSIFLITFSSSYAQKISPVTWSFEMKKVSDADVEITATAIINNGWTIYSQFTEDNGPVPTAFVIGNESVPFEEKSKSTKEFDPLFEVTVIKFKDKAIFTKIINKKDKNEISGYVTFMTCDGEKCLPPSDVDFSFKL